MSSPLTQCLLGLCAQVPHRAPARAAGQPAGLMYRSGPMDRMPMHVYGARESARLAAALAAVHIVRQLSLPSQYQSVTHAQRHARYT